MDMMMAKQMNDLTNKKKMLATQTCAFMCQLFLYANKAITIHTYNHVAKTFSLYNIKIFFLISL